MFHPPKDRPSSKTGQRGNKDHNPILLRLEWTRIMITGKRFLDSVFANLKTLCRKAPWRCGHALPIPRQTFLAFMVGLMITHPAMGALFHKPTIAALKQEIAQTNGDVAFVL